MAMSSCEKPEKLNGPTDSKLVVVSMVLGHVLDAGVEGLSLVVPVVWCGVAWRGVAWRGVVWCGMVWCDVVWCGVVWRSVVWCGVM